jgi:hypothetical protein
MTTMTMNRETALRRLEALCAVISTERCSQWPEFARLGLDLTERIVEFYEKAPALVREEAVTLRLSIEQVFYFVHSLFRVMTTFADAEDDGPAMSLAHCGTEFLSAALAEVTGQEQ